MPDARPALWIGHCRLTVSQPERSHDFYVQLGMRSVHRGDDIAITELRGGTHLLLFPGEPAGGEAPFDLMIEDLPARHDRWLAQGHDVTAIETDPVHSSFFVTDPDGHRVKVYDDHSVGPT